MLPILLLPLIRMTFPLSSLMALLFAFSFVNALHRQTLSGPWTKHHLKFRSDKKQNVLESSPEYSTDSHILHAPVSFHEQDACSNASSTNLVMGYYPDWAYPAFPPENIDFRRYDWIDFAFALPDADFALVWDDQDSGPKLLERLVTAAHAGGSKVKLSIGGWTGSQ